MAERDMQPFCAWCGQVCSPLYWVIFSPSTRRQVCVDCRAKLIRLLDTHQPPPPHVDPVIVVESSVPPPQPRRRGRPTGPRRVKPI